MTNVILKLLVIVFFAAMIFVNYLANTKPFNNQNTGEISDKYPNYFTPTGFTFAIWGVIYIMLFVFVIQFGVQNPSYFDNAYVTPFVIMFILSSAFNIAWLYMWHYDKLILSLVMMIGLLASLTVMMTLIPSSEILMKAPFSLYTAWITVATIANITIVLYAKQYDLFRRFDTYWFLTVITLGAALALIILFKTNDVLFGNVYIWAYFGILVKHLNKEPQFITNKKILYYHGFLWFLIIGVTIFTFIHNGYALY